MLLQPNARASATHVALHNLWYCSSACHLGLLSICQPLPYTTVYNVLPIRTYCHISIPTYEPPLLCTALSVGGTRVLNANFRVTSPFDFSAAGVKWQYRLGSTAETLSASGTLTQAADVEVLVARNGNSVQFTYEYVVYSTTTQPLTTTQPPTTQPTSNVTRTFSDTNQPFGEQHDRSLCALLHHVDDCSALNARFCMA